MIATAAALSAQAETIELLTNGATFSTQGFGNIIGWSTDKGTWTTCNTADGLDHIMAYYNYRLSTLSQTVTLADFGITANDVQSSDLVATASVMALCRGLGSVTNNVKVYQLDANGDVISTHLVMDRPGPAFDETEYSLPFTLNADTRKLKYELNAMTLENDDSSLRGPLFRLCSLKISWSSITFVSEGATIGTAVAQQGNAFPVAPEATKTDYGFLGYFTEETGGTKVYNADRTPVQSVWDSTEDATYYAHWEPVSVPFTVTLISDGNTVGTINARQSYDIDPVSVPTKAGNRFLGYWTGASGGEKFFNEDGTPVNAKWTRYENWTLYAHWAAVYSVTFVSTDATVGSGVYVEGGTGGAAPIPQRAGDYTFQGYYTEGGVQVFDASGALMEGAMSGLPSDVTLYAHWAVPEGSIAKLVYRGQLNLLTGDPAVHSSTYTKKMHFRVYDSSESTTPLWTTGEGGIEVTVNKDGSFVQEFGDDTLAELLATGTVTHVGLAIGDSAMELKPRRELRPVAAVNRALTAEGAALDIRIGNLVTDNALVAADATVSQLEVTGRVTAPGAGEVAVSPLTVGDRERTRLMRGAGVKAFSEAKPTVLVPDTGAKLRGEVIATAPSDGIALITSKAGGERALRCPAVVQYCRAGESVRAPTSEAGGLKVTFFPFVGKEGR